ncbi:Z1 domain-containing protein [Methanocorpusculum parvum]|uniref:Putative endonuclease Z1 domain-containing protein n=1 Tax=Methanocorpusculum parvum TaxID=2193 RepID=A0AAX0Q811_9EURY|nr:Z1 domain-containing protein [Methanocorpusculum parvum]PAV09601.1 hypothetical protein ASJ83_06205 [Methanocorpusculum parvum]
MIDISELDNSERLLYISAYEKCKKEISTRDLEPSKAIEEIVAKFKPLINDTVLLSRYLEGEINCSINYGKTVGIYGKNVRNTHWWSDYKGQNKKLNYWSRYSKYLIEYKGWDPVVVENSIDASTDIVMNVLANPITGEKQDIRGLVFGHVQSGKTAHYIGLINKAIDAGYKIIIVLSGVHNNLRSQTQTRIDEEVLGRESDLDKILSKKYVENKKVGVWKISSNQSISDFPVQALTSRNEKGDFNKAMLKLSLNPPLLIVTKKNKTVLETICNFCEKNNANVDRDADGISAKYPLLLIDDEADQASPNTKDCYTDTGELKPEYDASTINGLIRHLLDLFKCKSYVGYTATPYANIFIPPKVIDDKNGDDLFPRDFIIKMPKSPQYIGAKEFFGLKNDENEEMPLYREIKSETNTQTSSNQEEEIEDNKDSIGLMLESAIQMFFLSTAARNCRGQRNQANTMLIHTDRLKAEHSIWEGKINEYLETLRDQIVFNDEDTLQNLKNLWMDDYQQTSKKMYELYRNRVRKLPVGTWEDIEKELRILSRDGPSKIRLKKINGDSDDFLTYKDHKDNNQPYNVIVLGGDKLSRGLTLEGLTVSYFSRPSKNYDTLMQMGRWFGYRPGYLDLCRLFVPSGLYDNFRHISIATENLLGQIDYMNEMDATPEQFGLRVATHPDMIISNKNKIRTGQDVELSFSNTFSQTTRIDIDAKKYQNNYDTVVRLLNSLGPHMNAAEFVKELGLKDKTPQSNHIFWRHQPGELILEFFENYKTSKRSSKTNSNNMAEYVKNQLKFGGLTDWTVCLINIGKYHDLTIGPVKNIGRGIRRNTGKEGTIIDGVFSLKTLTSLNHEYLDYSQDQIDAMNKLKSDKKREGAKKVSADYLRDKVRERTQGLLILYPLDTDQIKELKIEGEDYSTPFAFAAVFPHNRNKGDILSYRLNDVGLQNEDLE